jgi:hypothetical protein
VEVNSQAALIICAGGQAFSVLSIEVEAERIQTIWIMANPEKLTLYPCSDRTSSRASRLGAQP